MTPAFDIRVGGRPVTVGGVGIATFTLTDNRAMLADTLSLDVADPADAIALPRRGAIIAFAFGYRETGLFDKGSYVVDGVRVDGPPQALTLTARSANFRQALNVPKSTSYHGKTLGDILSSIARAQGLGVAIADDLARILVDHMDQVGESDGHFISRLGRQYGAVATVKDGRLVFAPMNRGDTVTGRPLRPLSIGRAMTRRFSYTGADRSMKFGAVRAGWRDMDAAETRFVTVKAAGDLGGEAVKTLAQTYPDEAQARDACRGELMHLLNRGARLTLDLATALPGLIPETPINVDGIKAELDAVSWIADRVTHRLDAAGLSTSVDLVVKEGSAVP